MGIGWFPDGYNPEEYSHDEYWPDYGDAVMVDFDKYPRGKDGEWMPGVGINGEYYSNLNLIVALAKALVKAGVVSKSQVLEEL